MGLVRLLGSRLLLWLMCLRLCPRLCNCREWHATLILERCALFRVKLANMAWVALPLRMRTQASFMETLIRYNERAITTAQVRLLLLARS